MTVTENRDGNEISIRRFAFHDYERMMTVERLFRVAEYPFPIRSVVREHMEKPIQCFPDIEYTYATGVLTVTTKSFDRCGDNLLETAMETGTKHGPPEDVRLSLVDGHRRFCA